MPDTLRGGIVINEILVDPNGASNFDTDGNGTAAATDEFVELYNTSSTAIDISGLELWDAGTGQWFTFPPGTVLQPGAFATVITGVQSGGSLPTGGPNDFFFDAGRGTAVLNNGSDNLVLYDPDADTFIAGFYNGDTPDNPLSDYPGFSQTATQTGTTENYGSTDDGRSISRSPDGSDTFVGNQTPGPGVPTVCFTPGARILTPQGVRAVETIAAGDLVTTLDHGSQPVRWVGHRMIEGKLILQNKRLRPIRIQAGSLGRGLPQRDLVVSPQHRMLVSSPIVRRMFDTDEILIPAKKLVGLPGIERCDDGAPVTYCHLLFDRHEILLADGAPTESLFLGPMAITALEGEAKQETVDLFPKALEAGHALILGRLIPPGPAVRTLVMRHAKNGKPLLESFIHTREELSTKKLSKNKAIKQLSDRTAPAE